MDNSNTTDNILPIDYSENQNFVGGLKNTGKSMVNAGQHFLGFPKDIVTNMWNTTKNVGKILRHPIKNIPKAIVGTFTNTAESFLDRNIGIYSAGLDGIQALGSTFTNLAHGPAFLLDKLVKTPLHNVNEKLAIV